MISTTLPRTKGESRWGQTTFTLGRALAPEGPGDGPRVTFEGVPPEVRRLLGLGERITSPRKVVAGHI